MHLGQDDQSPPGARAITGDEALLGRGTHAPVELATAMGEADGLLPAPVDHLWAGPVVATPTKPRRPGTGTGTGYPYLAVERSPWPVWVTEEIDPESVGVLVEAGARHFVVASCSRQGPMP